MAKRLQLWDGVAIGAKHHADCGRCGAWKGMPCTDVSGRACPPHAARVKAFQAEQERWKSAALSRPSVASPLLPEGEQP